MTFYKNGNYSSMLDKTKNHLQDLLIKNSKVKTNKPRAIIMDVDDTLVFTNPGGHSDVRYVKLNNTTLFLYPGINQMIEVVQLAKKLNYRIIILTARPRESFLSTRFNLDLLKIPYDAIYLNPKNEASNFKYGVRKQLMNKYDILFSVGDQVADVNGPSGIIGIKLPSPDSHKVQIFE